MYSESEIEKLHKQKLWFNLCLYLQEHAESNISDCIAAYYKYILVNESSIHPYTFCKVTMVLSNFIEPERCQSMLEDASNAIQQKDFISDERQRTLLKIKIRQYENKLYLKQGGDMENFIYEIKIVKMDKETMHLYNRLCYKYYEHKANFEECHKYFEQYLSDPDINDYVPEAVIYDSQIMNRKYMSLYRSEKKNLAYKLVKFSLLNPKAFDFTVVTFHKMYNYLADEMLKELFENISIGNVEYVLENQKNITEMFPGHYELLKEKVYLVSFINLCFYNKERVLAVDDIMQHLNIGREDVFYVLMKAFGSELVKGVIDGVNDVVKFSYVIPRILNKDEILVLKNKYESWSEKISTMIKLAK